MKTVCLCRFLVSACLHQPYSIYSLLRQRRHGLGLYMPTGLVDKLLYLFQGKDLSVFSTYVRNNFHTNTLAMF
jgi:hypothetical protein